MGANSLNIGTGGTLGSAAFTDASAYQVPLSFSTGLTNNSNTVTSNLSTGMAGGQSVIGGTGVADILSLKGTTGNGTLTSPAIQALVGNNGGTIAMTILNNGYVGIGTTNPGAALGSQDKSRLQADLLQPAEFPPRASGAQSIQLSAVTQT